jgi:hypothetical protein
MLDLLRGSTMKRNIALVLVGLLIGCGAGAAATHRATAQGYPMAPMPAQPAHGQRWQQFCEQTGSAQEASSMAGARGAEGYELVTLYNGVLCFKRPLPPGAAPQGTPTWPGY